MSLSRPWQSLMLFLLAAAGVPASAGAQAKPDEDSVWVEGESASSPTGVGNPWYSDAVRKEQMSGGGWLSHFSATAAGEARYDVSIAKDGDYVLWLRGNPVA